MPREACETLAADRSRGVRSVTVAGGGTAGYLAALALRSFHPELDITLVESSKIPVIGVGESTTSEIVPFLHRVLGLETVDFFQRVLPTWKLGIKFVWGSPKNTYFNYPFDRGPILEAHLYSGHLHHCSPSAALMTAERSLILSVGSSEVSLLPFRPYAYHLDNKRFVQYLQSAALARGIRHIDDEIADVVLDATGRLVEHLTLKSGEILRSDFYVDCTGFRSLLMGRALQSPFIGYQTSLYADSAVVANAPHNGRIKPYTTAATMNHGWCWNIPQVDEDHLGYVFCSAFCSDDAALAEMRASHPDLHDPWMVRFRSGRHEHFVRGNVAAIGNAYGFVEPLESTAIFVIGRECLLLAQHLDRLLGDDETEEYLNATVASIADYLRWFLSVHYRFNGARETEFWRECRRNVDVAGAASIVSMYQRAAPLSYQADERSGFVSGQNFDAFGYDVLLLGQGLTAQYVAPPMIRSEYDQYLEQTQNLVRSALPQLEALQLCVRERPHLLSEPLEPDGWVSRMAMHMVQSVRSGGPSGGVGALSEKF